MRASDLDGPKQNRPQAAHGAEPAAKKVAKVSPNLPIKIKLRAFQDSESLQQEQKNQNYPTNKIRTARYNMFSFFPLAFLVQFTKLGNVFWVCQFILQSSSSAISTQSPWPILFLLTVIFTIGMLKEFLSDHKRKKADQQVNLTKYAAFVSLGQIDRETCPIQRVRQRSFSAKGHDGQEKEYFSNETFC